MANLSSSSRLTGCEPGAKWDALVDLERDTEARAHRLLQREERTTCGVVAHFARQLTGHATHRIDRHARVGAARYRDPVAERVDCKAEDVEADRHVADGRRGKGNRPLAGCAAHSRAPR
jgi:hypothetical protein